MPKVFKKDKKYIVFPYKHSEVSNYIKVIYGTALWLKKAETTGILTPFYDGKYQLVPVLPSPPDQSRMNPCQFYSDLKESLFVIIEQSFYKLRKVA